MEPPDDPDRQIADGVEQERAESGRAFGGVVRELGVIRGCEALAGPARICAGRPAERTFCGDVQAIRLPAFDHSFQAPVRHDRQADFGVARKRNRIPEIAGADNLELGSLFGDVVAQVFVCADDPVDLRGPGVADDKNSHGGGFPFLDERGDFLRAGS